MAATPTPQGTLRHRNVPGTSGSSSKKKDGASSDTDIDSILQASAAVSKPAGSGWDYKLALVVITALAFLTRFWGISHPNEVVFDEVHFGKVASSGPRTASFFFLFFFLPSPSSC